MTLRTWPLWALTATTCAVLAIFSYRYLVGIGPLAPNVLSNLFARPWLAVHVLGAATALLVGPLQLLPALRRRRGLHRWLGRVYATACVVGGTGGMVMAFGGASEDIARVCHPHPTRSEAVKQAAMGVEGWTMQA